MAHYTYDWLHGSPRISCVLSLVIGSWGPSAKHIDRAGAASAVVGLGWVDPDGPVGFGIRADRHRVPGQRDRNTEVVVCVCVRCLQVRLLGPRRARPHEHVDRAGAVCAVLGLSARWI